MPKQNHTLARGHPHPRRGRGGPGRPRHVGPARAARPGGHGDPLRHGHAPRRGGGPRPARRRPGPALADIAQHQERWDRVVPMGERAAAWLTRYLTEARPHLLFGEDPGAVFFATNGERLGATWLTGQVHHYIEAAEHRQEWGAATSSAIRAPRLWSKAERTSATSKSCSVTATSAPPTSTPGSPPSAWPPSMPPPTPGRDCPAAPMAATAPAVRQRAGGCATASGPSRVLR